MADNFAARQCEQYTVISLCPDWCKTPHKKSKPLPYLVSIDLGGSAGVSGNVNFNGNPAFLYGQSDTRTVEGDEPGTGTGVLSGTVGEKCEPVTHSPTVRINQKQLVRENDLFWMNNRNTLGKLTTRENGSAAQITDDASIAGDTAPDLWDDLEAQLEKGRAWAEQQRRDFKKAFTGTFEEEFKEVIDTGGEILDDPQAYARQQADAAIAAAEEAALDAKEIAETNAQRMQQLAERFKTAPAGAIAGMIQDRKDELMILKGTLGDTLSDTWGDIGDWGEEFGDKLDHAWEIAKTGDIGKAAGVLAATTVSAGVDVVNPGKKARAAGEVAGALGTAAKKSAALKKKKMAAQKKNAGGQGGGGQRDGGKSKGNDRKCKSQIPKGECAEQLIEKHHKGRDFEPLDMNRLKNNSGNGIDHAFNPDVS